MTENPDKSKAIEWLNKSGVTGRIANWEEIFQPGWPAEALLLTPRDIDRKGNVLAFGPITSEYSELETILLAAIAVKLLKTENGQKHLVHLLETYLTQSAHVISSLQKSSSSNALTAICNQFVSCKIYARMGLMTSFDALQTEVWLDHQIGEIIKSSYVGEMIGGLTTLVDVGSNVYQTHEKEETKVDVAGLATLAKLFGGK
ncbi:hypothetical protein MUP77_13570 [Candidatus Bathyarchaeota archaeon]|nr:hypothetical protein [Candidatus Bathyarchaeota archaeon]